MHLVWFSRAGILKGLFVSTSETAFSGCTWIDTGFSPLTESECPRELFCSLFAFQGLETLGSENLLKRLRKLSLLLPSHVLLGFLEKLTTMTKLSSCLGQNSSLCFPSNHPHSLMFTEVESFLSEDQRDPRLLPKGKFLSQKRRQKCFLTWNEGQGRWTLSWKSLQLERCQRKNFHVVLPEKMKEIPKRKIWKCCYYPNQHWVLQFQLH